MFENHSIEGLASGSSVYFTVFSYTVTFWQLSLFRSALVHRRVLAALSIGSVLVHGRVLTALSIGSVLVHGRVLAALSIS